MVPVTLIGGAILGDFAGGAGGEGVLSIAWGAGDSTPLKPIGKSLKRSISPEIGRSMVLVELAEMADVAEDVELFKDWLPPYPADGSPNAENADGPPGPPLLKAPEPAENNGCADDVENRW